MRLAALLLLGVVAAAPLEAQQPVVSAAPERVGVTIYRDPQRGSGQRPDLSWLNGYALISETRTVTLPAGESDLRFEGVASGIIPQSAILSGLPQGIVERNRDALLLSAGSLVARSLGQRVTVRRTDRGSGRIVEQEAVIRTGGDGGVVLETRDGIEALRCSGLAETLVYDRVPPGLSAKPTLSVRVRSAQPLTTTVTLSYLATGFDWQADYVGILSPDERSLRLQAWLTLASTDDTSFRNATAQAVAGRVNREAAYVPPAESPSIRLSCWPQGTTSDGSQPLADGLPPPPPPPPPPPATMAAPASEIIVTGSRIMSQRERLGDLQLYRFPEAVTIAANAQKQVGLIDQPGVKVSPLYRLAFNAGVEVEAEGRLLLRTANRTAEGLGLPLPAGSLVLFREGATRPLLIGETRLDDRAVGEKVEISLDSSPGLRGRLEKDGEDPDRYRLTLSNDRPIALAAEVELDVDQGRRVVDASRHLVRRDGRLLWLTEVPANGRAELRYRLRD